MSQDPQQLANEILQIIKAEDTLNALTQAQRKAVFAAFCTDCGASENELCTCPEDVEPF